MNLFNELLQYGVIALITVIIVLYAMKKNARLNTEEKNDVIKRC